MWKENLENRNTDVKRCALSIETFRLTSRTNLRRANSNLSFPPEANLMRRDNADGVGMA